MKRVLLAIAATIFVIGCTTTGIADSAGSVLDATGTHAPAPLANTTVDEKALILANHTADALATSVDALEAAKVIVPGTPRALTVKRALIALRDGLKAASAARKAGNATSYGVAISQAETAIAAVQAAISGR